MKQTVPEPDIQEMKEDNQKKKKKPCLQIGTHACTNAKKSPLIALKRIIISYTIMNGSLFSGNIHIFETYNYDLEKFKISTKL